MSLNDDIAGRLEEVAHVLAEQGANRYRVQAYQHAAATLRGLDRSALDLYTDEGLPGLERLPGVGKSIARAIRDILLHGRLAMLDRLRGDHDPIALLTSVPGIGKGFAWAIHEGLGIETLEELESAAHDGRLERFPGMGDKRLAGIRDSLAHRLGRIHDSAAKHSPPPTVAELLDIDAEYRRESALDNLGKIAPRRFNPEGQAWLPVLHTMRGDRHYTALFSNTARAHEKRMTRDWVILHCDDLGLENQWTIITSTFGPLKGKRIVRGREKECERHYRELGEDLG